MAHDYCPYELVFGKTSNLPKHFNSIDKIKHLNNIEDYVKESKFIYLFIYLFRQQLVP